MEHLLVGENRSIWYNSRIAHHSIAQRIIAQYNALWGNNRQSKARNYFKRHHIERQIFSMMLLISWWSVEPLDLQMCHIFKPSEDIGWQRRSEWISTKVSVKVNHLKWITSICWLHRGLYPEVLQIQTGWRRSFYSGDALGGRTTALQRICARKKPLYSSRMRECRGHACWTFEINEYF